MDKERKARIENLNHLRDVADEEKEKREQKLLMDIGTGITEMDDFFRTLTVDRDWSINCTLACLGDINDAFSAKVQMTSDANGILTVIIDDYAVCVRISSRDTVADAKDVLDAIREQCCHSSHPEWIFAHGGEVCDRIMDRLEEEYM